MNSYQSTRKPDNVTSGKSKAIHPICLHPGGDVAAFVAWNIATAQKCHRVTALYGSGWQIAVRLIMGRLQVGVRTVPYAIHTYDDGSALKPHALVEFSMMANSGEFWRILGFAWRSFPVLLSRWQLNKLIRAVTEMKINEGDKMNIIKGQYSRTSHQRDRMTQCDSMVSVKALSVCLF